MILEKKHEIKQAMIPYSPAEYYQANSNQLPTETG
jgi:hypothetical protein